MSVGVEHFILVCILICLMAKIH